jgi:hypothetical protein
MTMAAGTRRGIDDARGARSDGARQRRLEGRESAVTSRGWAALATSLGFAFAAGCSRPPPDATPDGAVRIFLDDMEVASEDPKAMRSAYDLLGPEARANLQERARRTSQLLGRQAAAWEMMAAGRFGLAFRPKVMRPTVVGDRATVEVLGADPQNEHATVACTRESGGWRVEPGLPEP